MTAHQVKVCPIVRLDGSRTNDPAILLGFKPAEFYLVSKKDYQLLAFERSGVVFPEWDRLSVIEEALGLPKQ